MPFNSGGLLGWAFDIITASEQSGLSLHGSERAPQLARSVTSESIGSRLESTLRIASNALASRERRPGRSSRCSRANRLTTPTVLSEADEPLQDERAAEPRSVGDRYRDVAGDRYRDGIDTGTGSIQRIDTEIDTGTEIDTETQRVVPDPAPLWPAAGLDPTALAHPTAGRAGHEVVGPRPPPISPRRITPSAAGCLHQGFVADVLGVMQAKAPNTLKSAGLVVRRDWMPACR